MLKVDQSAGVVTLTLDRPDLGNALGPVLVDTLVAEVDRVAADPAVHTLVLATSGRHFCTGLDLSELATLTDGDLLLRLVRIEMLLAKLWHAPMRTVALARGRTWGAGADLFAVCEHRFATADTRFRFPGAQFGIVLGTRRLAERIGPDAARRLVLEGGELDAARAQAAGLVGSITDMVALAEGQVDPVTARAIRKATRPDLRDADLAALVQSAAVPGLQARITAYRARMLAARPA